MVEWSDTEDAIIGGDLTAALAYATPAGGAVVTPVAPIGLRDRGAGTVGFTTSLGFSRKLQRIKQNPRIALAYHAREHGFATDPHFVLVQGQATYDAHPDAAVLEERVRPASERFMGSPQTGPFWDRWLRAYYADRVLVTVDVERVVSWTDARCSGEATVYGSALAPDGPPSQTSPGRGVAPRVNVERAARRLRRLPRVVATYLGSDGFPVIVPVRVGESGPDGFELAGPLSAGARRAGVMGHRYEPRLIGLETRQHTGWLQDGVYAPHTERGFRAPANKTLLLLANGFMARRGLKRASQKGSARRPDSVR